MTKNTVVLLIGVAIVALPFLFKQTPPTTDWHTGDPELIVITPNSEAVRFEFGQAFNRWHHANYGTPVKIDWRAIGGTSEIMRYLEGSFITAFRAFWEHSGNTWSQDAEKITDGRYINDSSAIVNLYRTYRDTDNWASFSANIDVFFGGGEYDHRIAYERGFTVPPWPQDQPPPDLFMADGIEMIPQSLSGETWRTPTLFGVAVSTFGICYNTDRLTDLGIALPTRWDDLASPKLIGQVGVADPTKSGSIAKAYEMIIQQKIYQTVRAAGYNDADINRFEAAFAQSSVQPWEVPIEVPTAYQKAMETGWLTGLQLIQKIGANARYFTDSATKVAIDVSKGDAAIGLVIDFYGRYQAKYSRTPNGQEHMAFITPEGGSSVSSDPVSLLRGAPHKALALRFMQFLMSEAGQKIWNYHPGESGGPIKYALKRLPIRRSFYPSEIAAVQQIYKSHQSHLTDDLGDPKINPYEIGRKFTYRKRWTGHHFNIHRNLIKAMCLDAGEELKAAWKAIQHHGAAENNPAAMQAFQALPDGLTWRSAIEGYHNALPLNYMERWVKHFRSTFTKAKILAETGAS